MSNSPIAVSASAAASQIQATLAEVVDHSGQAVNAAADLIADSITAGGVVQAFGTGHSEALAMEFAGRAGGLIPTNRLALRDVIIYGGERIEEADALAEHDPAIAHRVYELAPIEPADVFVIASNSGGNGAVIEMAQLAKQRGHSLIAITSMAHTQQIESRHPSGERLFELADVVLDNAAPYGDTLLEADNGINICAASSITAAMLAQMITAEVVARQLAAGQQPPVYVSANTPGGHEHNTHLEQAYAGRIRRGIA